MVRRGGTSRTEPESTGLDGIDLNTRQMAVNLTIHMPTNQPTTHPSSKISTRSTDHWEFTHPAGRNNMSALPRPLGSTIFSKQAKHNIRTCNEQSRI